MFHEFKVIFIYLFIYLNELILIFSNFLFGLFYRNLVVNLSEKIKQPNNTTNNANNESDTVLEIPEEAKQSLLQVNIHFHICIFFLYLIIFFYFCY